MFVSPCLAMSQQTKQTNQAMTMTSDVGNAWVLSRCSIQVSPFFWWVFPSPWKRKHHVASVSASENWGFSMAMPASLPEGKRRSPRKNVVKRLR